MDGVDHGGALDRAVADYGGAREDWLDLSTGINPMPYPVPEIPGAAWQRLPDETAMARCLEAARLYYGVPDGAEIAAAPGTQSIIQWLPSLCPAGPVVIVAPTYGEYAETWRRHGVETELVPDIASMPDDAAVAVVVRPNNPDGSIADGESLHELAAMMRARGGLLVIDEAFGDIEPEFSLVEHAGQGGWLILRSFGKFFGLAGLRLGFAIGDAGTVKRLETCLGPWAVSGPALHVGSVVLRDEEWIALTRRRLWRDSARLRELLQSADFAIVGEADLFILAAHGKATKLARKLAQRHILVRPFDYEPSWLRFGLPGDDAGFERLGEALTQIVKSKQKLAVKA